MQNLDYVNIINFQHIGARNMFHRKLKPIEMTEINQIVQLLRIYSN